MNGELNGTMEQCTDSSLPDTICEKIINIKNCDSEASNNEADNPLESVTSQHQDNTDSGDSTSKNNDDIQVDQCISETSNEPKEDHSSNEHINNHSTKSNESFAESVASSQGKMHKVTKDIDSDSNSVQAYTEKNNHDDEEAQEINSESCSEDEGSVLSRGPMADDTVSINSDSECDNEDDTSQESQTNNDIIIVENDRNENQNSNSLSCNSPEVHEIISDNDDCVVTNDDNSNAAEPPVRRSSRATKRKRYMEEIENGDDDSRLTVSDIEEVELEDPLSSRTKHIVINNTKDLVEMAAKKMKSNQNQEKEHTVVIIDTHTKKQSTCGKNSTSTSLTSSTQNLYQSMIARGTTVTPVSSKATANVSSPNSASSSQTSILPSLTDDMFVVEAPSFIVPYVYEKPSREPFREFVDKLGKELEEQKAKEEEERKQKEKEEKEKYLQLRKERKERGEEVSASEDEKEDPNEAAKEEERKKKKAEKREKRRRKNDDDDASWDGESTSDSEDETLSDNDTVVLKDKADSIEEIKDITDLTIDKVSTGKSDNYFDCSLGKFFVNIGLSLVQEFVQNDLLKQQNRKLYREKKSGHSTKETQSAIASLMKNLEFSKENNAPYVFPQNKCDFCSFKTESILALNHHLETPHMKNNLYKCNFCDYEIKSPHEILSHMENVHKIRGKLERAPAYHQCCNCPFEDNGKGKLARHQVACAKKFKPELNLSPPIEWEPPAKIPKIARARNNMMGTYQSAFNRQVGNNMVKTPINIANLMSGSGGFKPRGRSPLAAHSRAPVHGVPIMRANVGARHNAPTTGLYINNYPITNNSKPKSTHQPSISITPLPRQPQPTPPQTATKNTFVICEICDGYIKDLEQLRNHMQWIHKVKIHPKMIYNRPPLNCQKCQFRFFTDQGLERHLLGSHGLVTSSMQEAANKGKDAGRCPVCGRVYQWKLLNHVARDHNLTLKPAHLSYKCTVCTATFGMYKQFENHVYSAHSVVAKRVMDKSKAPPAAAAKPSSDSLLKPMKINDEITIIPQSAKAATSAKSK